MPFTGDPKRYQELRDKVLGGWAGKNIGGTMGGPLEGRKELMDYDFYPKLPDGPLANDDLDLQLVWLHALETYGPRLGAVELAQEWQEHVFFPYDEYGYALTNMRKGLRPPVSGWFDNPFTDCMGAPIRSEIWAMVCPGEPELAAYYAYQDGITDHAGGEGVYGEMFFAAIESAAFVQSDPTQLIEIGLSVIPQHSRVARAVRDTIAWHKQGLDWKECREKILEHHGRSNFTDAPQNIAFTILGWLYGTNFGDSISKAVNCGYDTDCTGATLGAILGIIHGFNALPGKWKEPLGDRVVVSPAVRGFPAPATLEELTERTLRVAQEVKAYWSGRPRPQVASLWNQRPQSNTYWIPQNSQGASGLEVTIHYGDDGPAAYPGETVRLTLELRNHSTDSWDGQVRFELPAGWKGDQEVAYALPPGETQRATVTLEAPPPSSARGSSDPARAIREDFALPVYRVGMRVERNHNGFFWAADRQELRFMRKVRWEIQSPSGERKTLIVPASRVDVAEAFSTLEEGVYRLRTTISVPSPRKSRLVIGTGNPVRVSLDGEQVFDDPNPADPTTAPAYHRGRGVTVELSQGKHNLEIELVHSGQHALDAQSLVLFFTLIATHEGKQPGPFFSYVDAIIG